VCDGQREECIHVRNAFVAALRSPQYYTGRLTPSIVCDDI